MFLVRGQLPPASHSAWLQKAATLATQLLLCPCTEEAYTEADPCAHPVCHPCGCTMGTEALGTWMARSGVPGLVVNATGSTCP